MKKRSEVILIFEIGNSRQKFFLLDRNFCIVDQGQTWSEELFDDDGDPMQDLDTIKVWVWEVISACLKSGDYQLRGINFSTCGASLVHISENGELVSPFYSNTKSFPYPLDEDFTLKYSEGGNRVLKSGSPGIGFINAGFQLYWLKYRKPEIYRKIRWSLHLPQYFCFLLTGIPLSDYTSLGCHTALWNYYAQKYDSWVLEEKVDRKLAPLVSPYTSIKTSVFDQRMTVGTGIHDISARLLPYLSSIKDPFILVSTGTWCVALNPFSDDQLTAQDIDRGCLYYMRVDGQRILANRRYLGFDHQIEKLARLYDSTIKKIKKIKYNPKMDQSIRLAKETYFHFEDLHAIQSHNHPLPVHFKLKKAYHQLMVELIDTQVRSIRSIIKKTDVRKIIIEGEFVHYDLYIKMIANQLHDSRLYISSTFNGSVFGSAIALVPEWWTKKLFKKHYRLERVR